MKPRIKFHRFPGDVSRGVKIAMLESRFPHRNRAKSFKGGLRMRERAVLKERARREVNDEELSSLAD
jgi:hypothetical protein